jgi:catalase (peroxidase I)
MCTTFNGTERVLDEEGRGTDLHALLTDSQDWWRDERAGHQGDGSSE